MLPAALHVVGVKLSKLDSTQAPPPPPPSHLIPVLPVLLAPSLISFSVLNQQSAPSSTPAAPVGTQRAALFLCRRLGRVARAVAVVAIGVNMHAFWVVVWGTQAKATSRVDVEDMATNENNLLLVGSRALTGTHSRGDLLLIFLPIQLILWALAGPRGPTAHPLAVVLGW